MESSFSDRPAGEPRVGEGGERAWAGGPAAREPSFAGQPMALTINPDAGWHRITADAGELEATRRAGEASLRTYPYYVLRYGERGRLFGESDGAWLATLCGGHDAEVARQVLWLAGVLSARGMPRWLLERHLELLHAELVRAYPERGGRYGSLLAAAARLHELRRARIADADFQALADGFARSADTEWVGRLPGMGEILVAAVADEADGIARAVSSLEPWATDAGRFPRAWTDAVRATLAAARRAVRWDAGGDG